MDEETKERVVKLTRFKLGQLPFRYLGVPVSGKRLKQTDCDFLVDKITARIITWVLRTSLMLAESR